MEHSRLLKFLVPEPIASNMAENNTQVESEVPGAQTLRGDPDENADTSSKPMIISSFIEVHTEVSDSEKVVRRHQVIRNGDTEKETSTEEKQQTKIPISRLRQTVEKVKAKRQNSNEKPKQSQIPRRTSLPKTVEQKTTEPLPLDDEFDKLFQEVVNPTDNTVVANLESKFEEIIHDYDENKIQPIDVDKIKKSRIPFLKRRSLPDGDNVQLRTNKILAARDKIRLRKSISNNDEKYEKVSNDIVESLNSENQRTGTESVINESENAKHEIESAITEKKEKQNATDKININKFESTFENSSTIETQESISTNINLNTHEIKLIKTISQVSDSSDLNNQKTEIPQNLSEKKNHDFQELKMTQMSFQNQNNDVLNQDSKSESSSPSKITKIIQSFSNENDQKDTNFNKSAFSRAENNETSIKQETKFYKTFSVENENYQNNTNDYTIIQKNITSSNSKENLIRNEGSVIENNKYYNTHMSLEENKAHYTVQVEISKEKSEIHESIDRIFSQNAKAEELTTKILQPSDENYHTENISKNVEKESINLDKINKGFKENDCEVSKSEAFSEKETASVSKDKDRGALYATTFKGKVGRMISKIDSKESIEIERINSIDELPKKKSILSKIAMFERQEPETSKTKNAKPKLTKLVTKDIQTEDVRVHVHTPLIVHEVFKPFQGKHALISENLKSEPPIAEIDEHSAFETKESEEIVEDNDSKSKTYKYEIPEPSTPISDAPVIIPKIRPVKEILSKFEHKSNSNDVPIKTKSFNYSVSKTELKMEENKVEITPEDKKVKVTPNSEVNQKTIEPPNTEITKLNIEQEPTAVENRVLNKITKSSEAILPNGNVKKILSRIKSFDKFELNKKEVAINKKELPRSRSVSEKIALFEGKLTPIKGKDVETINLTSTAIEPTITPISEDLQEKINELNTKYGTVNIPGVQLSNGVVMPVLAVGTANLNPKLIKHIIGAAIDMGYRAIDSAYIYGNEKEVGEAIRAKIEDGTVKREDLFIINKLWSTFHREDLVRVACEASLKAMGLDYFDLYLIHNPMSFKEGPSPLPKIATVIQYSQNTFIDAWHGMTTLITAKLVRAVGVSNFNSVQVQRVLDKGRVKPVVNQVECHPYLSQERLGKFCTERNITLSCFGVLGSKSTPAQYRGTTEAVIDDPLVKVLASGLGITPAQLLISYQLKNNHTVVVKCSTAEHLWDNIQSVNVNLSSAEVEGLNMLNKNKRIFNFIGMGDTHKNYPFNIPF